MDTATGSLPLELVEPPVGLWLLALLFFGIGDLLTTALGMSIGVSTEANPLVAVLVDRYGIAVLLPLKVVFLGGFYLAWKQLPLPYPTVVPATLAALGIVVTVWNAGILLMGVLS
jgi:hypothetical protein